MRRIVDAWRLAVAGLAAVAAVLMLAACGSTSSAPVGQNTAATITGNTGAAVGTGTGPATNTETTPTSTTYAATTTTPAATPASVHVGATANYETLPTAESFLGVATELSTVTSLSGTPQNPDPAFTDLVKNLSVGAPVLLRLGGDSTDWDWWQVPGEKTPPGIRYTMTPQWGQDVKALLEAADAKAMVGVNLELNSKKAAAYEVKEYEQYLGSKYIDGFELGNEPELYAAYNYYHLANGTGVRGRPLGGYTMQDYTRNFTQMSSVIPSSDKLIGPDSGSAEWLPDLGEMLSELPKRLALVTVHAYPLKHCSPSAHPTVNDFFTYASIQGLANSIHTMVEAAHAHGKPLRLDEIGGITCGGYAGVSNSFSEALWALNVLPYLWKAGVQGVNFQDVNGDLNQVFTATDGKSGWNVAVQPEYYGLLAFANVAPAGSRLLTTTFPDYSAFYGFAVKDPNGQHRVVLTNVGDQARTLGVTVSGGVGPGVLSLLTDSSLGATSGETLGGQTLSPGTGDLTGSTDYTLVRSSAKGVYEVRIPAHSAAILTVGS